MRTYLSWLVVSLLCLSCLSAAWAQQDYTAEQLDQLASPIALYPDPLLSTVTTASTHPDQIQTAAQQLKSGSKTANTSWDSSVQALYAYPDVLGMMAQNKEWTSALGWAASNQLVDLMDAVQRSRYKAKSAGQLSSNDKVQVIEEGTVIRVEPANPQIIYVPTQQPSSSSDDDDDDNFWAWGAGVATTALLYNSMYHWHDGCYYRPPYGYIPPGSYYRPYGNCGYPRATPYYPAGSALNRPVNVNNINTGNVRINTGNINTGNINRGNINTGNINRGNINTGNINTGNINRGNYNSGNFNRGGMTPTPRPTVAPPAWGGSMSRPNMPAMPAQRPAMADYSRAGDTFRSSNRGSYSRGSTSFSSGMSRGGRRR